MEITQNISRPLSTLKTIYQGLTMKTVKDQEAEFDGSIPDYQHFTPYACEIFLRLQTLYLLLKGSTIRGKIKEDKFSYAWKPLCDPTVSTANSHNKMQCKQSKMV